jgi:hypothetical protein
MAPGTWLCVLGAAGVEPGTEPPVGLRFDHLRALSGHLAERRWASAGRAVQIVLRRQA